MPFFMFLAALLAICPRLGAMQAKPKSPSPLSPWVQTQPTRHLLSVEDIPHLLTSIQKRIKRCEQAACPAEEKRLLRAIESAADPKRAKELRPFVLRSVKALDQYRLSQPHDPKVQTAALKEVLHLQRVLA